MYVGGFHSEKYCDPTYEYRLTSFRSFRGDAGTSGLLTPERSVTQAPAASRSQTWSTYGEWIQASGLWQAKQSMRAASRGDSQKSAAFGDPGGVASGGSLGGGTRDASVSGRSIW